MGGAFEALDAVSPCDLFLRSGEARPTVLLRDDGVVFADACVCRDEETAYLIFFGPETDDVSEWIRSHIPDFADLAITDLGESYRAVSLDGPYAWELCAELFGSDVVGIPPLGMMLTDKAVLFRIERTGEYGYCALVPRDDWNSFADELQTRGAEFDLAQADAAAWSQAVLENFSFDMSREGRYDLTPMALQLQWRLSSRKERYPGSDAIRSLRESGWDQRLTLVSAPDLIAPEAEITCGGKPVGRVLASGYSPLRGGYVGKAFDSTPLLARGFGWLPCGNPEADLDFGTGDQGHEHEGQPLPSQLSHKTRRHRLMRWEGCTVLVTGASRGLGRSIAKAFAHEGAFVGIGYHRFDREAARTLDEIQEGSGSGALVKADVRDHRATDAAIAAFVEQGRGHRRVGEQCGGD